MSNDHDFEAKVEATWSDALCTTQDLLACGCIHNHPELFITYCTYNMDK